MFIFGICFQILNLLFALEFYIQGGLAANTHLTLLNVKSAFANKYKYQCYPSVTGTTITFGKVFQVSSSDSLAEDSGEEHNVVDGARTVTVPYDGNFFGVYYCKCVINGETTFVNTTIVDLEDNFNSIVTPTNEKTSITASIGESVTVSFDVASSGDYIWRKDGALLDNYEDFYDVSSLSFANVQVEDGGMYELYVGTSSREEYKHSFIELIVRECEAGRWGAPDCAGICNNCYNGGVCDDDTGRCICAPGFKGGNCEETCGGNRFGLTCELRYTFKAEDPKDQCKGSHFCLPNPYGCDCATGYTGLKCLTDCQSGEFGAGCSQECHCASGGCDQYTGSCTSDSCASGWSGSNCQVPSVCPLGYYGQSCTLICHCDDNVECDKISGVCSNGKCAKGYTTYDNLFCESCRPGSYGYYCALDCNCESASCHHETGCDGGCFDNWLLDSCTTGLIASTNSKVNPGQISTFQCDVQGDVTGVNIQLVIGSESAEEIENTESNGVTKVTFSGEASPSHTYRCTITKDSVIAYWNHSLNLFELPTYTGRPSSLSVTGSSVELSWREWSTSNGDLGDAPVVGYVVHYKKASSSWNYIPQVNNPTATVTGLHWEEEYSFAVAAVREGGGGEGQRGSEVFTTSTICGEPSEPEVITDSRSEFPKTINLLWQPLTDTQSKCSAGIERYTISYRPVNTDMSMSLTNETTSTSYTIMGLETYTEYTISVTAKNKDFTGMTRVLQEFSPEEKPPVPDASAILECSFLTVSVKSSDSFSQNLYGNINGYDVRYRSGSSDQWKNLSILGDYISNDYKLAFVGDADYELNARLTNGAGAGIWSPSIPTEQITCKASSIPSFMIAVVIILSIIIFVNSLAFILFCRYNHSHGNNSTKRHVRDDSLKTKTRVAEESNAYAYANTVTSSELRDITDDPIILQDPIQEDQYYDVIKTETKITDEPNLSYEIPSNYAGHKMTGDSSNKDIPTYTNR